MAVIRPLLPLPRADATTTSPRPADKAWRVARLDADSELPLLAPLLQACMADASPGPKPSLAGLRAELAGRPDRRGVGYVARAAAGASTTDFVGLAIVVESGSAAGRRFSLSWLLVHPAARRRGVATALLRRACDHVRERGGTAIAAETLDAWPAAVAFWRSVGPGP